MNNIQVLVDSEAFHAHKNLADGEIYILHRTDIDPQEYISHWASLGIAPGAEIVSSGYDEDLDQDFIIVKGTE